MKRLFSILVFVAALLSGPSALAASIELEGDPVQGALLIGRTEPGPSVTVEAEPIRVSDDGVFLVGFGRDAPPLARIEAVYPDGTRESREVKVAKREYNIQRIEGVPQDTVTPKTQKPATGSAKRWSQQVTATSAALDLEAGVFALRDPRKIARSLKRSADASRRRKAEPFQSAMSMLTFYINRAGSQLPAAQRAVLEEAKDELRVLYGRPRRNPREP